MNQFVVAGFSEQICKLAQYNTSQDEQPSMAANVGKWLGGAALLGTAVAIGKGMIPQSEAARLAAIDTTYKAKTVEFLKNKRLKDFTDRLARVQ